MKSNAKKWIRTSLILYIVIISLIMIATVAWFINSDVASLETQSDMIITAGNKLEISNNGTEWGAKIELSGLNINYPDITGNGEKFFYPKSLDANDKVLSDPATFTTITDADSNGYYITVELKFRTSSQMDIYLAQGSYVNGVDLLAKDDLSGNIPNDAIAGAARVAFLEKTDSTLTLKNVWVPNENYSVTYNKDNVPSFSVNGLRETFYRDPTDANYGNKSPYGYLNVTPTSVSDVLWSNEDYYTGKVLVGTQNLATESAGENQASMINDAVSLLHFDQSDKIVEKTLVIKIWFEGTDREADTTLNGGDVKYRLNFIGIDKADSTENVDSITFSPSSGKISGVPEERILYSENGIDWKTYSNVVQFSEATDEFYVKLDETSAEKASEVIILSKE